MTAPIANACLLNHGDTIFTGDSITWMKSASVLRTFRDAFSGRIAATDIGGGLRAAITSGRSAGSSTFSTVSCSASKAWNPFLSMATGIISSLRTGSLVSPVPGARSKPSTRSKSIAAANTSFGRVADIMCGHIQNWRSCTASSGKPSAGQFPPASTSTTSTGTRPTIASRTSNCIRSQIMRGSTQKPAHGLAVMPLLMRLQERGWPKRQSIAASMVEQLWRSVSSILRPVPSAARDTSPSGPRGASFAVSVAGLNSGLLASNPADRIAANRGGVRW
jgi:hypothetical protein